MSEDLVRAKLVTNMRQPGGNTTGVSIMGTELDAKRLEILAEMLPARSSVMLLADPTEHRESRPALKTTAEALGLNLREAVAGTPQQIERALRDARLGPIGGGTDFLRCSAVNVGTTTIPTADLVRSDHHLRPRPHMRPARL